MNVSEFDDVWKLISKYAFEINTNSIDIDLTCVLCKKLMIDACQSVCGCLFCYKCISEFLNDGDKHCPGGKEQCRNECLSLERHISRIVGLNYKIAKATVKCPNDHCESRMELLQMEAHLKGCNRRSFECPYGSFGCQSDGACRDSVLQGDSSGHPLLLIEFMHNLKNEVSGLKNIIEKSKLEITSLWEDSKLKETQSEKLDMQIVEHKLEIEFLKKESLMKENRITALEEELRVVNDKLDYRCLENDKERGKIMKGTNDPTELFLSDVKTETNWVKVAYNHLKRELDEETERKKICDENRDRRIYNCIQLCPNVDQDFVWRCDDCVRNVGTLTEKRIFSESFYSNYYKLCLRMYVYGDNIGLCCVLMKGDNDDIVQWPLRHAVTLSILNQDTLRTHKSVTFKYETYHNRTAFDKSESTMNYYGIGARPFILYTAIKDVPSVIVGDSIVVSCILTAR